jgi:hypothetical protein
MNKTARPMPGRFAFPMNEAICVIGPSDNAALEHMNVRHPEQ